MLQLSFLRIHEDQVARLRQWMDELSRRQEEVQATLAREGTRHEMAYLLYDQQGPLCIYALEFADPEQARQAFASSTLPIDLEHTQMMKEIVAERITPELLFECIARDNT